VSRFGLLRRLRFATRFHCHDLSYTLERPVAAGDPFFRTLSVSSTVWPRRAPLYRVSQLCNFPSEVPRLVLPRNRYEELRLMEAKTFALECRRNVEPHASKLGPLCSRSNPFIFVAPNCHSRDVRSWKDGWPTLYPFFVARRVAACIDH